MGKGRWRSCTANRNHVGLYSQQLEPENKHGLSEPCAVKSRTHGSSGGKGPRGPYLSQFSGSSKEVLEQEVKPAVEQFMRVRGLELSQEKTVITHIENGFDFLGQNVRKYKEKLLIKPSKETGSEPFAELHI